MTARRTQDRRARSRAGLAARAGVPDTIDSRIHATQARLRMLGSQARTLRLLPRQPAASALNGRHASRLRGRGLDFEELRGYLPGDDPRTIDWKVTARTGEPHVRVFTEERDRPALIVVDQRMSMFFGTRHAMKSVTAAECAALAAFAVRNQGDRVGGIVFGDQVVAEIRPQRTTRALDRFLTAIDAANAELSADAPRVEMPLPLNQPLSAVARIARRDHLIVLISDFDGIDDRTERLVGRIARHNDVILCPVTDPMAHELPDGARLIISDGALQAELDTGEARVRRDLATFMSGRLATIFEWQRRFGMPVLPLSAGEETLPQVRRLLGLGKARRRAVRGRPG